MRRLARLASALIASCVSVVYAQSPAPQQPGPTFRAGVEIVQMDVSVLDKDRRPVKGLTAADFTILEGGRPQPIVAFDAVDIPDVDTAGAAWMRDAELNVVSNDRATRRVIVIVIDDTHIPLDKTKEVQRIARDVIERLGPEDIAAVTYTDQGRRQDMTQDRQRLLKAVDNFVPHPPGKGMGNSLSCRYRGKYKSNAACVIDTLVTAADALRNAPQGRKTLVYISAGVPFLFEMSDGRGADHWGDDMLAIRAMFTSLQQANVNVYPIDPSGVTGEGIMAPRLDALRMFAENTGGRATLFTNTPWEGVPQIFRENSSYYLLGFRPTNGNRDGSFHRVQIKVNRPDVEIRARNGYLAPDGADTASARVIDPVNKAMGQSVPGGDLRMSAMVAPFAMAGKKNAAVAVGTLLREPLSDTNQTVEVATLVLDSDCGDCRKLPSSRQVARFAPRPGQAPSRAEVLTRLELAPGSYEIRIGATLDGRTGSLIAHVDVPDFRKDKLSASGLVLGSNEAVATAERGILQDILPLVPTALREFSSATSALAFVRVYQGGSKATEPVRVTASILDAANNRKLEETTFLEAARFATTRSFDYRLDLPLSKLEAGPHLLTIEAHLGKSVVKREARFSVR
jgi:VWFA-related protein